MWHHLPKHVLLEWYVFFSTKMVIQFPNAHSVWILIIISWVRVCNILENILNFHSPSIPTYSRSWEVFFCVLSKPFPSA